MTNILRDLKEDIARGRVYLPREDLRHFDYSVDDLKRLKLNDQFVELIRFEIGRAERLYDSAGDLEPLLERDGRRALRTMMATYRALLEQNQSDAGSSAARTNSPARLGETSDCRRSAVDAAASPAPRNFLGDGVAMSAAESRPRVAIVGGGLAGLAAAVRLSEHGVAVKLFEARRQLGGRATSFRDPTTGVVVDHCQHVALGCCTNFIDFCERTGLTQFLTPHRTLHFFGPDGSRSDLTASRLLPAPLHLLPSLLRLKYLSGREKIGIVRAMRQLAYDSCSDDVNAPTIDAWLREHGQSDRVIELFWAQSLSAG